jgi:hypothetical protein
MPCRRRVSAGRTEGEGEVVMTDQTMEANAKNTSSIRDEPWRAFPRGETIPS